MTHPDESLDVKQILKVIVGLLADMKDVMRDMKESLDQIETKVQDFWDEDFEGD